MRGFFPFFLLMILLTFSGFAWLIYYSLNQLDPLEVSMEVKAGKQVWQQKGCVECHTLFGNGGYVAPDLTQELSRRKPEWIKKFLIEPPIVRPSKQKRHLKLSSGEADKIENLLEFTNKIVIPGGWPPEPMDLKRSR